MPASGYNRYIELFKHISNPFEYIFNRSKRRTRPLKFTTKPANIHFEVQQSLYPVFKEIFMEDVYCISSVVKELPSNPVIIDIGANAGFFDILFLSKIPGATIYAYEPLPDNIQQIQKLISANPQLQDKLLTTQAAVTGTAKQNIDLYIEKEPQSSVVASVFANFDKRNTRKISVQCITLTEIIINNNLQTVDVMKIDCEGSEYDILYNTDPSIIRRAKMLLIEVHDLDEHQNNITALNNFLKKTGYITTHRPINKFCHALEAVLNN
jgi:FkbM family methyltransferase